MAEVSQEYGKSVESWIEVKNVKDNKYVQILNTLIDLGEASTIALAVEIQDSLVILDDQKARKVAANLKLRFTGLLGVLLKARQEKVIDSLEEVLSKLKSAGFHISKEIENEVLRISQEMN